uniref:17-beta-hydroxysteroid dehydrogenase 14-like n=1 Tax=Styela clava TaxID=7725 RepID=UPI0019393868|nr:17-beta-hydroxysteroid dehydrogenase 14-like [Styela clava]
MLFQILLRAPVFLSKYALPHLKKTKGCIVNVSSVAAMMSSPNGVPYKMFKGALDHFTKGFASECSLFGVRVNSINPALVHTRILDTFGLAKDVLEKLIEKSEALHHFGVMQPGTIADGIKFLCSSPHITGITLPVTSGLSV